MHVRVLRCGTPPPMPRRTTGPAPCRGSTQSPGPRSGSTAGCRPRCCVPAPAAAGCWLPGRHRPGQCPGRRCHCVSIAVPGPGHPPAAAGVPDCHRARRWR
ncbi:hypothetical protein G6F62_015637 [Rhizopus arrhizus]|nr:hypothetical protein G6F62_015637 [Rhizopus arrhizus]